MRNALIAAAATVVALFLSTASGKELRFPSPDSALAAIYHYSDSAPDLVVSITFVDSAGHRLFGDDYADRDYRPAKGHWSASGRFFVYTLNSRGGHSPWHKPFVVADTQTRGCTRESDLGAGDCISDFRLSGRDTISYKILDRSKDDWSEDIPGIPVQFSLSQKLATQ